MSESEDALLASALAAVRERIERACDRAGRDPASVAIVAASKTVPVERLGAAAAAGLTRFGENRVQEAEAKVEALPNVEWHLIGHLQANKAARAVALFSVIQSVDSLELAARLDRVAGEARTAPLPVLLQVNVDADPAKSGFGPADLGRSLDALSDLHHLELRGLMTVGLMVPTPEEARPTFAQLAQLSARLRDRTTGLGADLSMGMTDDFEVAIEEGATIVRVGRAIFGERPGH